MRKLVLDQKAGNPMQVELANGKILFTCHEMEPIEFLLGGNPTLSQFKVLPLGMFDGILGMDWLSKSQAEIKCHKGTLSFVDLHGNKVHVLEPMGPRPYRAAAVSKSLQAIERAEKEATYLCGQTRPYESRENFWRTSLVK